jgi:erythromycin esterase
LINRPEPVSVLRTAPIVCLVAAIAILVFARVPQAGEGVPAPQEATADRDAFVEWARGRAIPITTADPAGPRADLEPLKAVIGDARLVCLGGSDYKAREQFLFTHRLVKFLVEELGFTVFAIEENLATSKQLNAYLLQGVGDPGAILNGMAAWDIWDNQETLALLKWMRAYNAAPAHKRKLRCYGIDINDPYAGLTDVVDYIGTVDPDYSFFLGRGPTNIRTFKADQWSVLIQRYAHMSGMRLRESEDFLNGLLVRLEANHADYVARSSEAQYQWAYREAACALKAHRFLAAGVVASPEEAANIRESAMADNVKWVLRQAGKDERMAVWAHNFHISRDYLDINLPDLPSMVSVYAMGTFLSAELADTMVTIGYAFDQANYPGSPVVPASSDWVDGALARVGKPLFVLDLRGAPEDGPVHTWLNSRHFMRGLGGTSKLTVARAYDALAFFEKVTPVVPTAAARARLDALPKP